MISLHDFIVRKKNYNFMKQKNPGVAAQAHLLSPIYTLLSPFLYTSQ